MFMDIKAIKVCKLMHLCAIIYNLSCLVYDIKRKYQVLCFDVILLEKQTNNNIFE